MTAEERLLGFQKVLTDHPDLWKSMWTKLVDRMTDDSMKILQVLPHLKQIRRADAVLSDESVSPEEKELYKTLRSHLLKTYIGMPFLMLEKKLSGAEKVDGVEARALRSLLRRMPGVFHGVQKESIYERIMGKLELRLEEPRNEIFTTVAMPPVGPFLNASIPPKLLEVKMTAKPAGDAAKARQVELEEAIKNKKEAKAAELLRGGGCDYFQGGTINMPRTDGDLVKLLKELLTQFDDFEGESAELLSSHNAADPIYLTDKTCPPGLRACDASLGNCPDDKFAPVPPLYTADGMRCYTNTEVKKSRSLQTRDSQIKLRDFVEQAAKLSARLQGELEEITTCPALTTQELCGMKTSCAWDVDSKTCK